MTLSRGVIEDYAARALREDLGEGGDITTEAVLDSGARARASLITREECCVAGLPLAEAVFRQTSSEIAMTLCSKDGESLGAGEAMMLLEGSAAGILAAERVALNFLAHLSGIATATAFLVKQIEGSGAKICCTRKTTPGLRVLEKYAVRMGGGVNHRARLDEGILIKDNHLALGSGVKEALARAEIYKKSVGCRSMKLEVEVDSLAGLEEALESGAELILLDNFSLEDLREAVKRSEGRAVLEASGGITGENARAIAETGVDYLSSGWITHSARSLDMSLEVLGGGS